MKMRISGWIKIVAILLIAGCNGSQKMSAEDYLKWLNDPENGLVQVKNVNGIKVSVKYLPNEYLVYKELKEIKTNDTTGIKDSLIKIHEHDRTFLFTIGPDEEKGNKDDIMLTGLRNYSEYVERALTMNFDLENYITLKTEKGEYKPVLSTMENVYGLSKTRNILFVFAPDKTANELKEISDMDFVYADEMFDMGILHFNFKQEDIEKTPAIKY